MKKHVIICGPPSPGKASLALQLVKGYHPSAVARFECIIPDDWFLLDPGTKVVVFESISLKDAKRLITMTGVNITNNNTIYPDFIITLHNIPNSFDLNVLRETSLLVYASKHAFKVDLEE